MNSNTKEKSQNILCWLNWLSKRWNKYEAFIDFNEGINPREVAENFVHLNELEFSKLCEELDKDDLDALDQMQKLTESESYVLKFIKDQIDLRGKVKYVDFNKKDR